MKGLILADQPFSTSLFSPTGGTYVYRFVWTMVLLAPLLCLDVKATEIHVSSMTALQSAINTASPGDTIVLANGTYTNATLTIGTSNITVRTATPGGVYLNGTQYIDVTGSYVRFTGFQFTSGDIGSGYLIMVHGSHNVLTQLNFNGYSAKKYISIAEGTSYNDISYCNIENKPVTAVTGCTIQINTSPTIVGYHTIRYCSFKNFPGPGGDYGNEPIRIGLSTEMTNISRSVVEYCYFENVGLGDGESISLKSTENICRYNTFSNNPDGMLVFRHGYWNVAYGNFFINGSGGIRIKEGANHYVYNNYFATGSTDAIKLQYVAEYPLVNVNFVHNTFVNSGEIDLGGAGPAGVTFANNIFKKSSGNIFSSPNGGTSWAGNIYQGTLGITISSGMTNADPLLVLNTDGYYGLSSASPAIDASSSSYPAILDIANIDDDPSVLLDISGQSRPATLTLKDVGCDEYTTGAITNRPLTLSDVGPSYLGGPHTHAITATAGAHGSIVPSGVVTVGYGANQTFTITPAVLHHLDSLLVDEVMVELTTSYTFTDVTANHAIRAVFRVNSTITLGVAFAGDWDLVANPVTNPVPGDSVRQLYPTSVYPYAFEFSDEYVLSYVLANGKGYWAKFPLAISQPVTGTPRMLDSISVVPGWNVVGTISCPVDTSTIVSVPAGLRGSPWFGYDSGYSAVTQLVPGKGYWVKANAAGTFVLACPTPGAPREQDVHGHIP